MPYAKTIIDNYRPVSVISVMSKVFECILADQLGNHFNEILFINMFAYRKTYSCENAFLAMTEILRQALDQRKYVGAILMDLSKAFDCLPHQLLSVNLNAYNMSIISCSIIASYYN